MSIGSRNFGDFARSFAFRSLAAVDFALGKSLFTIDSVRVGLFRIRGLGG